MYVPVASFGTLIVTLPESEGLSTIESARENQEREESAAKCCHLLLREMPDPVNGTFLFR